MATYDEHGNAIPEGVRDPSRLGQAASDSYSFGAALFEFFNPSRVQAEAQAMGIETPDYWDIWSGAAETAAGAAVEQRERVIEGATQAVAGMQVLLKLAIVGAVIWGVAEVLKRTGKRSE